MTTHDEERMWHLVGLWLAIGVLVTYGFFYSRADADCVQRGGVLVQAFPWYECVREQR